MEIATRVNRHRNTISNFLKNPETYGQLKRSGRPTNIDSRCKREIRRLAAQKEMSCKKIKHHLSLKVTERRIHQILVEDGTLKYCLREPVPRLLARYIKARLAIVGNINFVLTNSETFNFRTKKSST